MMAINFVMMGDEKKALKNQIDNSQQQQQQEAAPSPLNEVETNIQSEFVIFLRYYCCQLVLVSGQRGHRTKKRIMQCNYKDKSFAWFAFVTIIYAMRHAMGHTTCTQKVPTRTHTYLLLLS